MIDLQASVTVVHEFPRIHLTEADLRCKECLLAKLGPDYRGRLKAEFGLSAEAIDAALGAPE